MELFFHRSPNFGDSLNPWIFDRILPNAFSLERQDELFVGIGSLLGLMPGDGRPRTIFTAGFAAGNPATYGAKPQLTRADTLLAVRGPLSARELGLPEESAVTDGAALIRLMTRRLPPPLPTGRAAYMPHVGSLWYFDWRELAERAGLDFIDPRDSVDKVLGQIRSADVLVTESLHGAIVADVFETPWVAVRSSRAFNAFKWTDWAQSLGIEFDPIKIPMPVNAATVREAIKARSFGRLLPERMMGTIGHLYEATRSRRAADQVVASLHAAASRPQHPSPSEVTSLKAAQLAEILDVFAVNRFGRNLSL